MDRREPPRETTIVGEVIPSGWDQDDNVIGISVHTGKEEYLVEVDKVGQELFDFLDERVEVKGLVGVAKGGKKRIKAHSYQVVEESPAGAYGANEEGAGTPTDS